MQTRTEETRNRRRPRHRPYRRPIHSSGPAPEQPSSGTEAHGSGRPIGSLGETMRLVQHIRASLQEVAADMERVLEFLKKAEETKDLTEEELETLRNALGGLNRDRA